jgi:hypothetical protein
MNTDEHRSRRGLVRIGVDRWLIAFSVARGCRRQSAWEGKGFREKGLARGGTRWTLRRPVRHPARGPVALRCGRAQTRGRIAL